MYSDGTTNCESRTRANQMAPKQTRLRFWNDWNAAPRHTAHPRGDYIPQGVSHTHFPIADWSIHTANSLRTATHTCTLPHHGCRFPQCVPRRQLAMQMWRRKGGYRRVTTHIAAAWRARLYVLALCVYDEHTVAYRVYVCMRLCVSVKQCASGPIGCT